MLRAVSTRLSPRQANRCPHAQITFSERHIRAISHKNFGKRPYKLTRARTLVPATKVPDMIDVDKILKELRADLPANFDKGILASELRKAKSWYRVRSKIDKWPKREKIVGRFIADTKRYRVALKVYSEACQDIPLPFRLPSWLNTKALDAVMSEAEACIRPLKQDKASKQVTQKLLVELGSDRGSAKDFLLGSMLPKIFRRCFGIRISVRDSARTPDTPFVRFAVEAARQIVGKKPSPESVASSY
jgi:hypothetical protein